MIVSKRTLFVVFIIVLLQSFALIGCNSKSGELPQDPLIETEEQDKSLRVVYFSEDQFLQEYGNSYKKKFPNTDLQVIPYLLFQDGRTIPIDSTTIMEQKPDVIYGLNMITELAQSRKLVDLAAYMRQSGIEPEQFAAAAIEWLKNFGQGQLVALSPSFQTAALYYNKTLFDELKIPYPTANMSWESTLQLAAEISRKDLGRTIYGLYADEPANLTLSRFVSEMGIDPYSEDLRTSRHAGDDFRTAISRIVDAFQMNAIYLPPEKRISANTKKDYLLQNKFIAGEAAMSIRHPGLINDLADAVKEGIEPFEWDIVSEPINLLRPGQSSSIIVGDAFAISQDSPNKKTAWEFIQFVTGLEMAAELADTKPMVLSIRMDASKERNGRKLDAFHAHRPISVNNNITLPNQVAQQIYMTGNEMLMDIIYGRTSVTNGLESLQSRIQHMLDQAWGG